MNFLKTLLGQSKCRGFCPRGVLVFLFVVCGFIEIAAFGGKLINNRFASSRDLPLPHVKSKFGSLNLKLAELGPTQPKPPIERLMDAAHRLSVKTSIPYVFGGSQMGSPRRCSDCSECIRRRKLPANSSMDRFNQCKACRECGLDCSNFVSHLLKNAGLKSKFATTATLLRENERVLWKKYAFIDVGNQLEDAKPGDLILKNGHVVMLIDIQQPLGTVDFIHASRGSKRTQVGGIELRRGVSIKKIQRDTLRILRHKDLVEPNDSLLVLSKFRHLMTDLRERMVAI
jgi:cell wall-associated NlpC family hydrolase